MHLPSPTSKAAGEAAQHSASSELTLLIFGIGTGVTARALLESSVLASSSIVGWRALKLPFTFIPQLSVKDQTAHLLLTAAEPFNAVLLRQLRQLHTGTHTLCGRSVLFAHTFHQIH